MRVETGWTWGRRMTIDMKAKMRGLRFLWVLSAAGVAGWTAPTIPVPGIVFVYWLVTHMGALVAPTGNLATAPLGRALIHARRFP